MSLTLRDASEHAAVSPVESQLPWRVNVPSPFLKTRGVPWNGGPVQLTSPGRAPGRQAILDLPRNAPNSRDVPHLAVTTVPTGYSLQVKAARDPPGCMLDSQAKHAGRSGWMFQAPQTSTSSPPLDGDLSRGAGFSCSRLISETCTRASILVQLNEHGH